MPNQKDNEPPAGARRERFTPTASTVLEDGALVELVYEPKARRTSLAVWRNQACEVVTSIELPRDARLVPYSLGNNLIKNDLVLLPSGTEEYGSEAELVTEIQTYIHRYVDLSPQFERIASYYVLFSWLYDGFNELPYLRVRGDYGSGKTRFLLIAGSLCYKPVFASGASTVSPIFHILDAFRGTLVIDEGDFRWSDDKADIVKILNNGNVKGLPVLRTEVSRTGEFNPRAFQVFGPKTWQPEGSTMIAPSKVASSRRKLATAALGETSGLTCQHHIRRRRCICATNFCCTDFDTMERKLRSTLSWTANSNPDLIRSSCPFKRNRGRGGSCRDQRGCTPTPSGDRRGSWHGCRSASP
jgi:hypothetical protein